MVRMQLQLALDYMVDGAGADFIFNIHAARTAAQHVTLERLDLTPPLQTRLHTDPITQNRYLRLRAANGPLSLRYAATIDIHHHMVDPALVPEVPVSAVKPEVLPYLYPSRYCPSDRMTALAHREFGWMPQGMTRVLAIQQWVRQRLTFAANSSDVHTCAMETLRHGRGVCRDFAHVMIALCRALNIPARFTTGTDYGADPSLGPPDFHAYVEVWLGQRWYVFDPSGTAIPMGLVRFGTGRDAADAAFATIFGSVRSRPPVIQAEAVGIAHGGGAQPVHGPLVVSTDDGLWPQWAATQTTPAAPAVAPVAQAQPVPA